MEILEPLAAEIDAIVALWSTTSRATYTFLPRKHTEDEDREYFADHIAGRCDLWAAVGEDGTIVGFIAIAGSNIDGLYIHPERQREGIGTRLMQHAMALSPEGLELCTHQKNVQARAFYTKQGFRAIRYGVSPPPENEPDVEYQWRPRAP